MSWTNTSRFRFALGLLLLASTARCNEALPMKDAVFPTEPPSDPGIVPAPMVADGNLSRAPGWSWVKLPAPTRFNTVWSTAADDVWFGGVDGQLLHYDGTAFHSVASPTKLCVRSLFGSDGSDIWAVATDQCPFPLGANSTRSEILHWNGAAWTSVLMREGELKAVTASARDDAWITGYTRTAGGFIMHWDGTSWQTLPKILGSIPMALWTQSRDDVWLVSAWSLHPVPQTSRVQHWDGSNWNWSQDGTDFLYGVWSNKRGEFWAVGHGNSLWHYDGTAVRALGAFSGNPYTSTSLVAIWGSAANDIWATDTDSSYGQIAHWDGTAFTEVPVPTNSGASAYLLCGQGLWGSRAGDVWVVGTQGILHWNQP